MSDSKQYEWPRKAFTEHPALLISVIYFFASLIGLVYSWAFLNAFDINVFRYADVSDFLLASLKEPFTWLLAISAVAVVAYDNAMSLRSQRRGASRFFGWYGSERYRQANYLVAMFLVVAFLYAYAVKKEQSIRDGEGELVTVHLTDSSPPKQLVILGTTARFVFFFDARAERVDIHPNENISMITKLSPGPEREE